MAQTIAYEPAQTKENPTLRTPQEPAGNNEISDHDQWLLDTPEVLASVKQGLVDSAAGRVHRRQSYADHADDILED